MLFFSRSFPLVRTSSSFQDLPCSLLKPVSKSCCLYGGGRVASIFRPSATLFHTSSAKGDFAHDLAISSLHQQFTFVHLFDTHLPRFPRLFPVRSPPKPYGFSSAGWFDNPTCTALSMSQLFIIFKRTSWHKQRNAEECTLRSQGFQDTIFLIFDSSPLDKT